MRSRRHIGKVVQYYEHLNDCTQRIQKSHLNGATSRYLIALFLEINMSKVWCGDFIVVTERVEKHSDWKLLMFRAEGTAGPEFRCETVNRGHRFESTVQRRFLEAA